MLAVTNLLLFESKKKNQIYPDANTGSFLKEGSKFYNKLWFILLLEIFWQKFVHNAGGYNLSPGCGILQAAYDVMCPKIQVSWALLWTINLCFAFNILSFALIKYNAVFRDL